jgi:hypothetical protein
MAQPSSCACHAASIKTLPGSSERCWTESRRHEPHSRTRRTSQVENRLKQLRGVERLANVHIEARVEPLQMVSFPRESREMLRFSDGSNARTWRINEWPSSPGIPMSEMMMSGACSERMASATQWCALAPSLGVGSGGEESERVHLSRCRYSVRRSIPRTCAVRALLPFRSRSAREM